MYDQWTLTTQYFEIPNITGQVEEHQLISNINSCLTSPNTLKDLFFPPRYPDIERLADIFEVITVNLTRMFVQWFWYRMETQGSNNLGDFHLRGSPASEKIHQPDAQMETVCGGGKIWRMHIIHISHLYKWFLLQAIASAAWGFVQASRETDEEQERAWCQVNLNQLFLQF